MCIVSATSFHYDGLPARPFPIAAMDTRIYSKATIRFSYGEKLPATLIRRIAKLRAAEAAER